MWNFVVMAGGVLTLLLGFTIPAQAAQPRFECPESIDVATTSQARAEVQKLLPPGNAINDPTRLNASIDALKAQGLSRTLIIDHLIGAYCPIVASESSLSDADKSAKVRRFASRITPLVYQVENVSEIILNVPLKPTVVDEINAKARKSRTSVEDWLAKAIETAVNQP